MKRIVLFFAILVCATMHAVNYDVVPMPQQVALQQEEPFVLNNAVQILVADGLQQEAEFLQSYLQELTGLALTISQKREKRVSYIELALSPKVKSAEGYWLIVNKKGVIITGGSAAGVFYGTIVFFPVVHKWQKRLCTSPFIQNRFKRIQKMRKKFRSIQRISCDFLKCSSRISDFWRKII